MIEAPGSGNRMIEEAEADGYWGPFDDDGAVDDVYESYPEKDIEEYVAELKYENARQFDEIRRLKRSVWDFKKFILYEELGIIDLNYHCKQTLLKLGISEREMEWAIKYYGDMEHEFECEFLLDDKYQGEFL